MPITSTWEGRDIEPPQMRGKEFIRAMGLLLDETRATLGRLERAERPGLVVHDGPMCWWGRRPGPHRACLPGRIGAAGDLPVALVSLGTGYNHRPDFYRTVLRAAAGRAWHVVLAVGEVDPGPVKWRRFSAIGNVAP
ncbi:hypothetical protein [Nonomuraea sp. NPDC049480]|uniref:hypothetical protein n=1 Tax=Nonomuraea sp. NPDC049480 TaxID=3364353 RepID=UPI0037BCBF30